MNNENINNRFRWTVFTRMVSIVGVGIIASCASDGNGQLGPACTDYLGDQGCCIKSAGTNTAAVAKCQQLAVQYASVADSAQAEASCQASLAAAAAAGLCTAGGGTDPSPSAGCASYLACVSNVKPDDFPGALMAYGPSSPCWGSTTLGASCSAACKGAINELRKLPAAATVPQCSTCVTSADCGGALASCDPASKRCVAGCLIAGSFQPAGTSSPTNACQSCQPYTTTSDWTPAMDGTSCGTGRACMNSDCLPRFSPQSSATTFDLHGVWGSGKVVYAVGLAGDMVKTSDGVTWAERDRATNQSLTAVWGVDEQHVYIVGNQGTLSYTADGGTTWTAQDGSGVALAAIWGSSGKNIYAVGTGPVNLIDTADGKTWYPEGALPNYPMYGVWGSGGNVYLVGASGRINYTKNDGTTWTPLTGSTPDLSGVWGSSATEVYAVGKGGTIVHTKDGMTFTRLMSGTTNDLYGVWGSSSSDVYIVGSGGTILHTADGGATFVPIVSGTTHNLYAVWGSGSDDVYAVGGAGTIVHYP